MCLQHVASANVRITLHLQKMPSSWKTELIKAACYHKGKNPKQITNPKHDYLKMYDLQIKIIKSGKIS